MGRDGPTIYPMPLPPPPSGRGRRTILPLQAQPKPAERHQRPRSPGEQPPRNEAGSRNRRRPGMSNMADPTMVELFAGSDAEPERPRSRSNRPQFTLEDYRRAEMPKASAKRPPLNPPPPVAPKANIMRGTASRSRSDPRVAPVAGQEPTGESAERRRVIGAGKASAPVAPKMQPTPQDNNARLGYPRSLPPPPASPPKAKAKATPKETPTAKKSAPPVRHAPADHGGAALAIRSVPKVPMRPDDTRRELNRNALAGALSDGTLPYGRPRSAQTTSGVS